MRESSHRSNYGWDGKPVVLIVDGSTAVTGALISAARQADALRADADVVLVLPRGHRVPSAYTTAFAEVAELPLVPLRRSVTSLLAYFPALFLASILLRRLLSRHRSSRIQFNDFYFAHGAVLRLLGFGGRIVTFVRIDPRRFGLPGRLWLKAARWSSNELVAVSQFIQLILGPAYPATIIYEQTRGDEAPARQQPSSGRLFLFVGNIIEGKGQDDAVRAFNYLAARYPDARLRFVGGDMGLAKNRVFRDFLFRLANEGPAAERIEFRPASEDLRADHAEAFAALNFSASESFSLTCLEASERGLPLVATRCGGPEEIVVDGKTGFLVAVGDIEAMADRMARLLDDPATATALGRAGQNWVHRQFSPRKAGALLREALALPPRAA